MQFSFLVPDAYLELAEISTHQLIIPQYYLRSRRYQDFCKRMKARGDFIILDNGFPEHGYRFSESWGSLLPIANDLEPHVVVLPEYPGVDYDLLVKDLQYAAWVRANIAGWEYMYVPRALWLRDLDEELYSMRECDRDNIITWIGLHKDMERFAKGNLGGRRAIMLAFHDFLRNYKIHMLGVYKNPVGELLSFREFPNVYSCDSAKPWRITSLGRAMNEYQALPPGWDFMQSYDEVTFTYVKNQFNKFWREIVLGGVAEVSVR